MKNNKKGFSTPLLLLLIILIIFGGVYYYKSKKINSELPTVSNNSSSQVTKLGTLPKKFNDVVFSPDGSKVAYGVHEDSEKSWFGTFLENTVKKAYATTYKYSNWYVAINGERLSRTYKESVGFLTFSPDSKRFAFVAIDENYKTYLVVDNKEYEMPGTVMYPTFSPDSKRIAYVLSTKEGYKVINDDLNGNKQEGKTYPFINQLKFTPDSKTLVHAVCGDNIKREKCFVVNGNNEGKTYAGGVDWITVSEDSKNITYVAFNDTYNGQRFLVVNNKESKPYDDIWSPAFSKDGKGISFGARNGQQIFLVTNDKPDKLYDLGFTYGFRNNYIPQINYVAFNPNGDTVAYAISRKHLADWFAVIGNKEGKLYDRVRGVVWGPTGKKVAYIASTEQKGVDTIDKEVVVIDEVEGQKYDQIYPESLKFSSDGKQVMYGAQKGKNLVWVVDTLK